MPLLTQTTYFVSKARQKGEKMEIKRHIKYETHMNVREEKGGDLPCLAGTGEASGSDPRVQYAFGRRKPGNLASMNLSFTRGDEEACVGKIIGGSLRLWVFLRRIS